MTFAHKVKTELCTAKNNDSSEKDRFLEKAELYGLLLFGRRFSREKIVFQTEHKDVADKVSDIFFNLYNIKPEHNTITRADGRIICCLGVYDRALSRRIFSDFGHDDTHDVALRINRANIENQECAFAFVRGAFLACGSIVDPGKDYHLEFVSSHIRLGQDLADFMQEIGLGPKTIVRKGNFVIYFKDSEQIEDVLTLMGAVKSSLELMNIKVYKDLRNKVNRVTNCETANISKTVNASWKQIDAIKKLTAQKGYDSLPTELREIAKIRIENPDASLRELAKIAGISRSGVNHRLRRIIDMAEDR